MLDSDLRSTWDSRTPGRDPGQGQRASRKLQTTASDAVYWRRHAGFRGITMLRTRRALLVSLAALPAFCSRSWAQSAASPAQVFRKQPDPITSADQVLNIMDFEPLAREALPPAHFAYIATGADDDLT